MGTHIKSRATQDHVTKAMDALRRIVQALRSGANAAQRNSGLSVAQMFMLQKLAPHAATINELAALTRTHQSSASVVVARLCKRGFAKRRADARDARKVVVEITAAGKRVLAKAPAMPQAKLIAAMARLSAAQRATLSHLLSSVARRMGLRDGDAPLFFEKV
jgi:DNA-binding MarR family transcriptional regulator